MKKLIILCSAAAVLGLFPVNTINAATQVYDLKTDWSDTQNPNGTWSYLGPFGLLSNDPFPWASVESACGGVVAVTKATQATAVPEILEIGDIYATTSICVPEVRIRWTAPGDGTIDISGGVWNATPDQFISWTLLHNGSFLADGAVFGSTRSAPGDLNTGTLFYNPGAWLNIPVQAGDQVDLVFSDQLFSFEPGPFGINVTVTFTPDSVVVDPLAAIEALALAVLEMNLQNGIENSLDSKLDAALNALMDVNFNNDGAACNSLSAFINAVEAQRGNKLTSGQADQLIAAAQEIQAMLNCGN